MIYVGIDIAKLNHFASAISSDGEELIKPFKFTNDNDGFQLLLSRLDPLDKDSLIIGLESTAHYGDNLVRYLVAKNYKVCVLNPIKTSKKTRMSKRGSKVLRYALVNAAHNVVKNNATFKAYYDAKMAEGRTHYNALGHCAGKLVRIIWKIMTDNVEFNLD